MHTGDLVATILSGTILMVIAFGVAFLIGYGYGIRDCLQNPEWYADHERSIRRLLMTTKPPTCRRCGDAATLAIRSGLEWHPYCAECASWWGEHRHGALSEVDLHYVYEP